MDDRARIALSMGIGAAVGGFVGFLLFTDRGRTFPVSYTHLTLPTIYSV